MSQCISYQYHNVQNTSTYCVYIYIFILYVCISIYLSIYLLIYLSTCDIRDHHHCLQCNTPPRVENPPPSLPRDWPPSCGTIIRVAFAIEHDPLILDLSINKWWFCIVFCMFTRGYRMVPPFVS